MNNQSKNPIFAEEDLNNAEKSMLEAFRTRQPQTESLNGAEVRGDFLRDLFLGYYDEKTGYRGTCIVGAVISDVLNMEFCETKFPVRFRDCTFTGRIKMQQLKCPELDFGACILKQGMHASYAKVGGDVSLGRGLVAEDSVILSGADIGGQLRCRDGHFQNAEGFALNAQGIKVANGVFLNDGFTAEGCVRLASADIGGHLMCCDGHFKNTGEDALDAQGIKVVDSVFLNDGFTAEGCVRLVSADIGQLQCEKGSFQKAEGDTEDQSAKEGALNASKITVARDVFLDKGLKADGRVSLSGANIGGKLVLKNAHLTHLDLTGTNVSGEFQDTPDAYEIGGADDSSDSKNPARINLDIEGFRYGRLVDGDAERVQFRLEWVAGFTSGSKDSWFRKLLVRVCKVLLWVPKLLLKCLGIKGGKFRPQPYEQLMKVYRETGHINWVRKVGFELERKRGKNFDSLRWRAWYGVLRLVLGYGYKPLKIVGWWSLFLAVSIWLFGNASPCTSPAQVDQMNQLEADAGQAWWKWPQHCMATSPPGSGHPRFRPVFYAVEVVIPALPLGQTGYWYPEKTWVARTQGGLTIAGSVLLAILAAYGISILPGGGRGDR